MVRNMCATFVKHECDPEMLIAKMLAFAQLFYSPDQMQINTTSG